LNVDNITLLIGLSIAKEGIEPLRISKIESIITITRMILKNIVYQKITLKKNNTLANSVSDKNRATI
jgi:hypothetical protein